MDKDLCAICGRPKDEHHEFVSRESFRPKGCKCNLGDWGDIESITPVCDNFEPISYDEQEICKHCEHERVCHGI